MSKGKLIVIEGTDGSGKATQTKLLVANLRKHKVKAVGLDFPQYQTFFGKLVARYLKNEFGKIDPYLAAVLYADNRLEFRDKIIQWLKQGFTVVLNRYVSSNQIHQAAHIDSRSKRNQFVKWIGKMEYEIMGLPKPDLTLFLNVPPEISYQMIEKKDKKARTYVQGSKRDLLESDFEHQKSALKQSLTLLKHDSKWTRIDCAKQNKLLPKEGIAIKIWLQVKKLVK